MSPDHTVNCMFKMKADSLTPILRTWDFTVTIEFYKNVLGFECKNYEPDWGWATLTFEAIVVMFSGPNEHEGDKAPSFTGSLYFSVNDVDNLWTQLKDKARVCYQLETFEYGMREFGIYDNNGYLLQFGQDISKE